MSLYSKLYDLPSVNNLLGCLLLDPTLCLSDKYKLDLTDFYDPDIERGFQFQRLMYGAINNLATQGFKVVEYNNIGDYMIKWRPQYKILEENNYMDFCTTYKKLSSVKNVQGYYNNVRKMSLLAEYVKNGYDISKFYNIDGDEDKERAKLESVEIDDIVGYFSGQQLDIEKRYSSEILSMEETKAGENFAEVKEMLQQEPLFGHSFTSDLLNSATRGQVDGFLSCFSSPTGVGKSTIAYANICKLCAKQVWDENEQDFVDNKANTCNGGLVIQFELDNELEVIPKLISNISGISTNVILDGKYTKEQSERIDRANEILIESNIFVVYMPNFTIKTIRNCIKEYVVKYGIGFVVFDYLQECSALNNEMSSQNGKVGLRTDQVLMNLSSELKSMAREFNVPIYTMSQCNANLATAQIIDQSVIAGSRSVANKFDIGAVLLPLRPNEEKLVDEFMRAFKIGGFNRVKPTHCFHIYKSRFSAHPQNLKIWVNIDLGIGKVTDCWTTTWDNKPYKLEPRKLEKVE